MPGYVSHMVMARDVYNKLRIKNVDFDNMVTYSLGGDLCKYSKCRRDSHKFKLDEFIYMMCDYIKSNELYNDDEVIGVLYGHICHKVMDNVIHPYVYKLDRECIDVGFKKHTLIESYIDSYLVRYKYDMNIDEYSNKKYLCGSMNRDISRMIDYVYMEVYDTKRVSIYYKINLFLYRCIRLLYRLFGIKLLSRICKYDKFISENYDRFRNLEDDINIGNYDNNELIGLYNKSIDMAVGYIDDVNRYLEIS